MSRADSGADARWWDALPVSRVQGAVVSALESGPLILTAPTGSGKSTLVPRWCVEAKGRTLVVEPRRVACRALWRFQQEMGGISVGYLVRHEQQSADARLLYVTPGVALRMAEEGDLWDFGCVVLDEFHERSLETDLLAALLRDSPLGRSLVVMSATIRTGPLAEWLGASMLEAEGRLHPVSLSYESHGGEAVVPGARGLEDRVARAVGGLLPDLGAYDILVFLPGRGEIGAARSALNRALPGLEVLELHAGLAPRRQDLVFRRPRASRVVLATNVAESSVTLPWVRAVVDSGLERRTSYRRGRSVLSLEVISRQSADQRAGRAGRLGPGRCVRLWSEGAVLRESSVPEILREDLDSLVLHCARIGKKIEDLAFLDPPRPDVVRAARTRLERLGLLDAEGALTDLGRRAASLPLDPDLARLVLAGMERSDRRVAEDLVDLAASLSTPGPLFSTSGVSRRDAGRDPGRGGGRRRRGRKTAGRKAEVEEDGPFSSDVEARLSALRGLAEVAGTRPAMLAEARRVAGQLRALLGLPQDLPKREPLPAAVLGPVVLEALPDACFVRRRSRYAGGGTEASLSPASYASPSSEAVLVFDMHSARRRGMRAEHWITCAMPIPARLAVQAGLGQEELVRVDRLSDGRLMGRVARRHAGVALDREDQELLGRLACLGAARLFIQGRWLPKGLDELEAARQKRVLYYRMNREGVPEELQWDAEKWVTARLETLGVQSGKDLELVTLEDLMPREPNEARLQDFDRRFPVRLKLVDRTCEVRYNLDSKTVVLSHRSGRKDPPPRPSDLPSWPGWGVLYKVHSRTWRLR